MGHSPPHDGTDPLAHPPGSFLSAAPYGGQDLQHIRLVYLVDPQISQDWEGMSLQRLHPGNPMLLVPPPWKVGLMGLAGGFPKRGNGGPTFFDHRVQTLGYGGAVANREASGIGQTYSRVSS
jgi:hypothetical protein